VRDRIATAQNAFFLPATRIARGPVVGTRASVKRASPEKLRRLYRRHYVPARAILVVVGDIEPSAMEAEIASSFSDWEGSAGEARAERFPATPSARQERALLFVDRAAPTGITVASVAPLGGSSDTAGSRDAHFLERLGNEMLNRRLARIAAQPGSRFSTASAAIYSHFSTARMTSLDITARDRDWRGALKGAAIELRLALDHGFSQVELDGQLAVTRAGFVGSASPRTSIELADAIVDAAGRGLVFTAAADPASTSAYLGRVRLDEVNAAFRAAWSGAGQMLFVSHNRTVAGAEAEIAAAWDEGFAQAGSVPR
jgi:zinc protease